MLKNNRNLQNMPGTLSKLYEKGDPAALTGFLDSLLDKEQAWTADGVSDGFYAYSLIRSCLERSLEEANTDMTSFLLSYQNRHFDSSFQEAAEENDTDILFGLKERPRIYYSVGSVMEFGCFPWSDLPEAPREPILWEVLALRKNRALLLAKYGIDARPYHDAYLDITWENCSLRRWLNTDFLRDSFSPEEQEKILRVTNRNPGNETYHIKGGNNTVDSVFLLNSREVRAFCPDPYFLSKTASPYAKKAGAETDGSGRCRWLLRSPGNMWLSVGSIAEDGSPDDSGIFVNNAQCAICPALWIRLPE